MIKKRIKIIKYTLNHKKAFIHTEKALIGKNTINGYLHDLDKLIMYCILPIPYKMIHRIHSKISRHHLNSFRKNKDIINMIIDWESARLTKHDKQLTAREFLELKHPEKLKEFEPYLLKLKL